MLISPIWIKTINDYLIEQRAGGFPETTIASRKQQLEHLARRIGVEPAGVTGANLLAYVGAQTWATETRRGRRTTFRSFFVSQVKAGRRQDSPADALPRVKPTRGVPRPIPASMYALALAKSDERLRLMLRLAHDAGLRRAEIAGIHSEDLFEDLHGWSLLVHGKGGKQRHIPLTNRLALDLRALEAGFAFPGDDEGHLSPRWVGKLAVGVLPEPWTIHTLRHSFASRAYAVANDLFAVQELLGHASPVTTRVYVQLQDDTLRRTVLAAAS